MQRVAAVLFVLVSTVALATCGRDASGPVVPVPTAAISVGGNGQSAPAGSPLPDPLIVLVTAADGSPVAGASVLWSVTAGGGSVAASNSTTDSLGHATAQLTLGTTAGTNADTVTARVDRLASPVVFTATAMPAAPATLSIAAGNSQNGTVGRTLADSLVVTVRDGFGNASPGVAVTWVVSAGSGSLSASATLTDAAGRSAVSWTLGTAAGSASDSAVASVTGLAGSPARFAASARPGPVSALSRVRGDHQAGTVGRALADSLVVFAQDQFGNAVSGAPVTWATATGSVSAASAPTDAAGRSAIVWTLGTTAGAQSATATLVSAAGSPLSFAATAAAGPAAALAFIAQPAAAAAGTAITPAVRVSVVDAFANPVPSAAGPIDIALAANGSGATLTGVTQVVPTGGTATFAGLRIDKTGDYALVATGAGLPADTSAQFAITPAGGPRLVFTGAPGDAVAGAAIPSVQVTAQDSLGNTITAFSGTVTLAIGANPGGGTLTGSVTAAAVLGVATFGNLSIDKTGAGYALTATASGAASGSSGPFAITPGPAAQLVFTVQPSSPFEGSAITPAVQVTARDARGNTAAGFTGAVTMALGANPSGGTLSGILATSAVAGVATFANLRIDLAGAGYALSASATGVTSAASLPFQVVHLDQFTRLTFTTEPSDISAGAAIAPAVTVAVVDQLGNPATGYSGAVTITLAANPAAGTLSGTTTVLAASGVATFADLHLDKRGGGYRLRTNAAGLAPDTSTVFAVNAAAAARIAIQAGDGQTAPAGTTLPVKYSVQVFDAFDNPVTGGTVNWAIGSGGGAVTPAQGVTDSSGRASTTRTLGLHPGAQTVNASVSGLADSVAAFDATATANATISGKVTLVGGFLAPPAATAVFSQPREAHPVKYSADELIVTYQSAALSAPPLGSVALAAPATAALLATTIHDRLAAQAAAARFEIRGVSPVLLAARLRVPDSTQLDAVAAVLRQDPAVLAVERNSIVRLEAHHAAAAALAAALPGDPLYARQAWHYGMIDAPRAWAITTGSASVLVAVVDNGIRYDHPAVAANLTHDGYDFTSKGSVPLCAGGSIDNAGDGDGYDADPTQPADYDYDDAKNCAIGLTTSGDHGLHVAGTIGAVGNDGVGVTGINWTVRIRPVRVLGTAGFGTIYDIAQGILYAAGLSADNGKGGTVKAPSAARVINLSLGGSSGSSTLHNAVIAATNAGALVVAAAGNSGNTSLLYPAAYPEALSVSAVGPDGLLASYSSYGSTIDIAAPGGDITDGDASFGVLSSTWNYVTNAPIYDSWDGTSMATPHVSGVAALLLAQSPSLTVAQLRARLTTYAVDAGAPGPDDHYGAGIVNARNSLTQTLAPPAQPYARLYDAATGALVATTAVAADGSYAFTTLGDGAYQVFAGADENADGKLGLPGRAWGALGGSATPSILSVDGAATYPATFSVALPVEHEPNDAPAQANALPIGGYVSAAMGTVSDVDVFRVRVPLGGVYTFETSAVNGACGFALEENTRLTLADSSGTIVGSNDDIDAAALNLCSRVTATLSPGSYLVSVQGTRAMRYRLAARAGP